MGVRGPGPPIALGLMETESTAQGTATTLHRGNVQVSEAEVPIPEGLATQRPWPVPTQSAHLASGVNLLPNTQKPSRLWAKTAVKRRTCRITDRRKGLEKTNFPRWYWQVGPAAGPLEACQTVLHRWLPRWADATKTCTQAPTVAPVSAPCCTRPPCLPPSRRVRPHSETPCNHRKKCAAHIDSEITTLSQRCPAESSAHQFPVLFLNLKSAFLHSLLWLSTSKAQK